MASFKTGAAWLAVRAGTPIIPVGIWGSERVWAPRREWRFWVRPHVTVAFGKPYVPQALFNPEQSYGSATKVVLQEVTDDMGYRVAALLPEEYRGYYSSQRPYKTNDTGNWDSRELSQPWERWQAEGQ